ncbi:MAG: hypothetical protein HN580_21270 [Deltaproteobacteria bacterium]|jgi:hypothetical protein|nr:hypothetical protein [Deltaproteobacteria bacterium]MBT4262619.1 hypothetical protein [Deltaproteobacteria bacterium]MBT4644769.1 hypothetical protein [Deltaproteobacteria bacterium]MBT6499388.1 hypothetical protein [Deltaproteobacteria bacterium]MBT6610732.1 hypothetical protein [Deltaproteobacteria bacterium]
MKNNHQVALSLVTGAIVGAVVLGIVGKIVMVFVAYRIGSEPNISLKGILEVLLFGGLVGTVGGILVLPLRKIVHGGTILRGFALGVILFGATLFTVIHADRFEFNNSGLQWFIFSIVVFMYTIFGAILETILTRFEKGRL